MRSNSRNMTPQGSPEHKARRQEEPIEPITIPAPRTDAGKKKRGKKSNPNSPVLKSSSPPPKAVEEAEGVLSAKLTEQKTSSGGAKGPKLSAGAEAARIVDELQVTKPNTDKPLLETRHSATPS